MAEITSTLGKTIEALTTKLSQVTAENERLTRSVKNLEDSNTSSVAKCENFEEDFQKFRKTTAEAIASIVPTDAIVALARAFENVDVRTPCMYVDITFGSMTVQPPAASTTSTASAPSNSEAAGTDASTDASTDTNTDTEEPKETKSPRQQEPKSREFKWGARVTFDGQGKFYRVDVTLNGEHYHCDEYPCGDGRYGKIVNGGVPNLLATVRETAAFAKAKFTQEFLVNEAAQGGDSRMNMSDFVRLLQGLGARVVSGRDGSDGGY